MSFTPGASSSSSSKELAPWKHDVFLSFRGDDTRMGFTDHLYDALVRKGISTYRDDEKLQIGKFIRPELLQAIEESKFAVVVLSENYADSTWCLDELVKIMERVETRKLILVPVFYHVDPSDVRHQRKTFGHDFAKHEQDSEIALEKVNSWRSAFEKVGDIVGSHITGNQYETKNIDKIVTMISQELQDTIPRVVIKGLVGIESRVKELNSLLCIESNDIRFIGISGMSGMGKTILAKAIYDGLHNQFQGYSFIGNIKDISKESDKKLCKLQQKVLVDILKEEIRIDSNEHGMNTLQSRLHGIKILLVLDDVNNADQLNCLAKERNWFGSGSRVIITTTNEDLLNRHNVDRRYKCEGLNYDDARRLFNLSAFGKEQAEQGYEELSNDIVELADGLPLALNVFGSLLIGKQENYWRETLEKLQQCPEESILKRLKICYGRLDRNEQKIFMYLSCFLNGRDKGLVEDILKSIGLSPTRGIDTLTNRSLITINYDDTVWMHDLLQQMGWEILREQFPKVGNRTGLKSRKDIVDIVTSEEQGTEAIEIINQEMYNVEVENCTGKRESFSKMKKLKFLRIRNVLLRDGLEYLSNDLRILEWPCPT